MTGVCLPFDPVAVRRHLNNAESSHSDLMTECCQFRALVLSSMPPWATDGDPKKALRNTHARIYIKSASARVPVEHNKNKDPVPYLHQGERDACTAVQSDQHKTRIIS